MPPSRSSEWLKRLSDVCLSEWTSSGACESVCTNQSSPFSIAGRRGHREALDSRSSMHIGSMRNYFNYAESTAKSLRFDCFLARVLLIYDKQTCQDLKPECQVNWVTCLRIVTVMRSTFHQRNLYFFALLWDGIWYFSCSEFV